MKKSAIIIICLITIFLNNCAPTIHNNEIIVRPTFRDYSCDYESVWKSTVISIGNYPILNSDKESGLINTDWREYLDSVDAKIWRGVVFGGWVEDSVPVEVRERLNIHVVKKENNISSVNINREIKIRPYKQAVGGKGSFIPDQYADFVVNKTNFKTEERILNKIEKLIQ